MIWLFLLMALVAGIFMPVQAGINGLLARELSSTLAAATVSFIIGTLGLLRLPTFYERVHAPTMGTTEAG